VARDVTLLIKLNDQASGKIGKITNSTKQLERAANGAQNSIRRTNKGIRETGRAADTASKGVNRLGKAIRGLIAGFGVFQAGKFVIFKTAELERQTKSLEVLTGSLGNARSIIKELQQFGAVTPFTSSELVETAKRLKAFGFETEQIVDVTKRLADVAGATGADLGGIATAFGQIQAKGRLQGEELLQLQERGIGLQDELQKMYGLTADEFRKALEGGRISADAVNLALQNITDTGGKYANGAIAQSETLAGKFSTLVDGIERIAVTIGNVVSPALKGIIGEAITAVNFITKAINNAALANNLGLSGASISRLQQQADKEAERLVNLRDPQRRLSGFERSGLFNELRQERFRDLLQQTGFRTGQLQAEISAPAEKTTTQPPALLSGRGGGGSKGSTTTDPLASLKAQVKQLELRNALAAAGTEEERVQAQLLFDIGELTAIRTDDNATLVDQAIKLTGKLAFQNQQNREAKRIEEERARQAKVLNDLYQQVGNTISTAIVDSLMQAKSVTEALGGALQGIGRQLLQLGVNSLLKLAFPTSSLFSALPGFASGGRPAVGRPSVVGERGPELFVPDRAGTILPNGVGMGSTTITVNVDASETSADASSGQGAQLGKAIGLAVQQELLKQKRPGGLLAAV
jgi:tape measure domain-containing protein